MSLRQVAAMSLVVLIAAGASLGLEGSRWQGDPGPCRFLIEGIKRHQKGMEQAFHELSELRRVASELDRAKIEELLRRASEDRERLYALLDQVLGQVDLSCDECLGRVCKTIEPKLAEIRDRIAQMTQNVTRARMEFRGRIATGKRVGLAIRATDRALVRAAKLAKKTESGVDAFPGLRRAFELQEKAKQQLAAGHLKPAMKMTLRARDLIGRTMRAALDSAEVAMVRERVVEFWKQTNRMMKQIARQIDPEQDPKAARLLKMARDEQERARELWEEHPYRAFRHAKAARRIVNEMIRFHRRAQHCEERAERLGDRIEEAKEIVEESDNDKAAQILEKGIAHYEQAVELCSQGNTRQATVEFDIAAKLVAKAVDVAKGNTPRDHALKREIRKTSMIVKKAGEMAETEAQEKKVERAKELVEEAKEKLDEPKVCLKLLDKATDLAFSVIAQAGKRSADDEEENE